MYFANTSEEVLTSTDPRIANDPRVVLLRKPCPRKTCLAPRGHYCRTPGGYATLHKARDPEGYRAAMEAL
jgi:hypothetical protein